MVPFESLKELTFKVIKPGLTLTDGGQCEGRPPVTNTHIYISTGNFHMEKGNDPFRHCGRIF